MGIAIISMVWVNTPPQKYFGSFGLVGHRLSRAPSAPLHGLHMPWIHSIALLIGCKLNFSTFGVLIR